MSDRQHRVDDRNRSRQPNIPHVRSRICFRTLPVLFQKLFPNARKISHRLRVRLAKVPEFPRAFRYARNLASIDTGIHPRKLLAVLARREQSVAIGADAETSALAITSDNR